MPIHLPACNRRQFLVTLGAGAVAYSLPAFGRQDQVDRALIYLVNDTHIGEKHAPDSPVPTHLRQVVEELVGLQRKPACVIVNGDLALRDGQAGDYRHFAELIKPLREAGIDVHLTMGNHDDREVFYRTLKAERPDAAITSRHVSIVETPFANLFLLDSLLKTMVVQGSLGEQQRFWLAKSLDERSTKPAIIVAHHNPRLGGDPKHFPGGLVDSDELWAILAQRHQVKAYVHGHVHDRSFAEHQGIHIVNTPATSYVADSRTSTTGWTTVALSVEGAVLTTRTNDPQHPWNGQQRTLVWRS
ncbi:MAG: metallophosphoesterase [Planctomycetes bacterium]|nr:metallophosphoesterase [Planctomycetota bacterium]